MVLSEKNIKACVLETIVGGKRKIDGVKILAPVERINAGVYTREIEMNLEEAEKLLAELTTSCFNARHFKETGEVLTYDAAELGKIIINNVKNIVNKSYSTQAS
jgi:hypothetical protein